MTRAEQRDLAALRWLFCYVVSEVAPIGRWRRSWARAAEHWADEYQRLGGGRLR